MTARRPFEAGAGPWVARRDAPHPRKPGQRQISWLRQTETDHIGWTTDVAAALRFDNRSEAQAALRATRGGRGPVRGIRDTAVHVGPQASPDPRCATCGGRCLWADDAWVCRRCGDEWYPDHGTQYAPPGQEKEA